MLDPEDLRRIELQLVETSDIRGQHTALRLPMVPLRLVQETSLYECLPTNIIESFLPGHLPTAAGLQVPIRLTNLAPKSSPHRRVALDDRIVWGG
jgi:hypothetical protein